MPASRIGRRFSGLTLAALFVLSLVPGTGSIAAADPSPPPPVDPQNWVDQKDLTWAAYQPVPNQPPEWRTGGIRGTQNDYTGAVVMLDFTDQPFLITQQPESHVFGNPQPGFQPVPREGVAPWMEEYLNTPNQYNGGQSITGYWMEDSHGKISVDLTAFGPFLLPGKLHEYGLADYAPISGTNSRCPAGDVCNKSIRTDGLALWRAAAGPMVDSQFNSIFYVTAAHDESSTWQEFGEMLFQTQDDVPAAFGPPGAGGETPPLNNAGQPMPNWSPTRYVPWTSWRAAANHWPNASGNSTTQAESSGQSVYAHEFSHVRGLPDNYNNPFANTIRNYTGYWEMMSRGTFNGPGGTHNRWQVPNAGGSGLGPHHMVEFKRQLGVLDPQDQVLLQRTDLPSQGIAVARLKARSSVPAGDPVALQATLGTGGYSGAKCSSENTDPAFWCPPGTNWLNYTMEVVDRVGNDSFAPGNGVLLALSRSSGSPRVWLIDSNPQDIGMIDFYRPDGSPVSVVRGDPRQLNDGTFHAGTGSGSDFEYVDNNLHFYILQKHRDAAGVLSYDVGVRNITGAGVFTRGVDLGEPAVTRDGSRTLIDVPLTNTGQAGQGIFDSDIYRISATVQGEGWDVSLPYEVVAAKGEPTAGAAGGPGGELEPVTSLLPPGPLDEPEQEPQAEAAEAAQTVPVHVYALAADDASLDAAVTITATSEADPSVSETIVVPLSNRPIWAFDGFRPPVENPPAVNDANAGSAVPVKFSLDGDQGLDIFEPGSPQSQPIDCVTGTPTGPGMPTQTAGGSGLQYDADADQYVYVWKTDGLWEGSCRELVVELLDGSRHTALLRFS